MDYVNAIRKLQNITSNLNYINEGATREVYKISNSTRIPKELKQWSVSNGVIVKKAIGNRGKNANKLEYKAWRKWSYHRLFCPAYDLINNGEYLIMAEADVKNVNVGMWQDVKERYSNNPNFTVTNNTDINSRNIGIYKGNPVIIDYSFAIEDNKSLKRNR